MKEVRPLIVLKTLTLISSISSTFRGVVTRSFSKVPSEEGAHVTVRTTLLSHVKEALAAGAFGVPSFVVDDKLFWGLDGLPMLKACLQGDAWFDSPNWDSAASVQVGVRRV